MHEEFEAMSSVDGVGHESAEGLRFIRAENNAEAGSLSRRDHLRGWLKSELRYTACFQGYMNILAQVIINREVARGCALDKH